MDKNVKSSSSVDLDYSLEAVPQDSTERKGFWGLFVVMLGFTFFSASMSVGANMANGLNFSTFVKAILIGGLILSVYTGLLAYVGSASGLSMDLLAQRSFGTIGSYLPSALISFTQIGWFGVGAAMFAYPVSELTGINHWIFIVLVGVLMTSSAYFGMKGLTLVSFISVPLITILGVYSMILATRNGGGLIAMFDQSQGNMTLFAAVGMVVGSFVSGGTATPNFVRFSKTKKIAITTTVIAFFLGNTLMFLFGAVGGAFTGKDDIFYVMIAQGLTIPAILVLGANIWTTNDNALYSSALGLSNITKIRKKPLTLVAGAIGTLLAVWLYNNFVGWLSLLNATLPPVGAILVLDYFIHKENYASDSLEPTRKVNITAIVGVAAGALAANLLNWGIASINAMVVAIFCYLVGELINRKQKNTNN